MYIQFLLFVKRFRNKLDEKTDIPFALGPLMIHLTG